MRAFVATLACLLGVSTSAMADHNSRFGAGTGLDPRSNHGSRYEANTHGPGNAGALKGSRNEEPGRAGEARRGAPDTVTSARGGGKRGGRP